MKHQAQIITVVALCGVFGAMGAAWQFYFKEIFDQYRADDAMRELLESSLSQLQETFQGHKPELLIDAWQKQVPAWRNAREERSTYFNFGDWFSVDVKPDETRMLKFWYTEESNKMTMDLYLKVFEKMGTYDRFPQDIRAVFNIQSENDWAGSEISMQDVQVNLTYLNFAMSLTGFLLDANIVSVDSIVPWPRRVPTMFEELLALQTVGLRFTITARDLAKMLDDLRQEQRYFTVDAISVTYPYISYQGEPLLNVAMLLTQANYRKPPEQPERTEPQIGDPGAMAVARPPIASFPKEGIAAKAWRLFKHHVLYMN